MASFADSLRQEPAYPLESIVDSCEQAIKFECGRLRTVGHAAGVVSDYDSVQTLVYPHPQRTADEIEKEYRKDILRKPGIVMKTYYYMDDKGGRYTAPYPLEIPAQHIDAVVQQLHQRVRALGFTRYSLTPMRMRQVLRLIEPASFLKPVKVTDQVQPFSTYWIYVQLYW